MDKQFKQMENEIIKWFLKNCNVDFSLGGFRYITYILTKRLLNKWTEENITIQYEKTAEHFNVTSSIVQRNIKHFISTFEHNTTNSKFLAKTYYLIKIYLDENQRS